MPPPFDVQDPSVKKQYVYLAQTEKPLWHKYSWNAFSLILAGLPSVFMANKALDRGAAEDDKRAKERAEERAERSRERAEERAERAAIARANALIWEQNRGRWSWQQRPPVTSGEEAQAVLGR